MDGIYYRLQCKITEIYILYMLTVFVWYTHYKYYDIMQAKRAIFVIGSVVYISVLAILQIIVYIRKAQNTHPRIEKRYFYIISFLLIVNMLLSLIQAMNRKESFWGYEGKCTGLLVYLLGIISSLFILEFLKWSSLLTWGLIICSATVNVLQILNRWGIDPLHMYENMYEEQIRFFISTIGQVNYNAAFNCIMCAVFMPLYLTCKERLSKLTYGSCLFLIYAGSICCCADSVYLGVGISFLILFIYVSKKPEYWDSIWQEIMILFSAVIVIWFVFNFIKDTYFWDLSELFTNTIVVGAISVIVLLFGIAGSWFQKKSARIWQGFIYTLIGVLPIAVAGILIGQKGVEHWKLMLSWAGYRGEIWRRAVVLFDKGSLWQKIFGYGYNNVSQALAQYGLSDFGDTMIADMHNVVLNTLVTSGICGVILWGLLLGILCKEAGKTMTDRSESLLVICGIGAYLIQGMVNGPQILTTPFFLIELGVFGYIVYGRKE